MTQPAAARNQTTNSPLHAAFQTAIREEDLAAVARVLLAQALEGNLQAVRLLLNYTLGKPGGKTPPVEEETPAAGETVPPEADDPLLTPAEPVDRRPAPQPWTAPRRETSPPLHDRICNAQRDFATLLESDDDPRVWHRLAGDD